MESLTILTTGKRLNILFISVPAIPHIRIYLKKIKKIVCIIV